ncbi:MAG: superoxide dismutase [Magnetococcales bacterium]|nr:superoxide dismutase [Magnetococcales bacterium]
MDTYQVREELKPKGLDGISDAQIEDHWGLYKGYVAQANALRKELGELRAAGRGGEPIFADRRRRFGFEYGGMVLHEYYFGNLRTGIGSLTEGGFAAAVVEQFGSFDDWLKDLVNTGKTRGIGWAVCALDPATGVIINQFIQLHEEGAIAAFLPLVVLDVFEHAYMVDHRAGGRAAYIDAFVKNIDWEKVERRFIAGREGRVPERF